MDMLYPSVSGQVGGASFNAAGVRLQAATNAMAQNARSDNPKLVAQAKEFEAYFIQQFISLMRPEPDKDAPFGGGFGEQMFNNTLNEKMGAAIAARGGFGVADSIVRQVQARDAYARMMAAESVDPALE